jgi:pimeloyl-ACP methyl ester carboxylesterase
MPKALVNGVSLHYVQVGDGGAHHRENLVMLHGLASNLAFWYFQYAHEFARRFRVTLIDLRGHGASDITPEGYSPSELARDVGGLLEKLHIGPAHFMAHSFGGLVALHHARREPGSVRSLVLADSYVPSLRKHASTPIWKHGKLIQPILTRHGIELDTDDPHFGFHLLGVMAGLRVHDRAVPEELQHVFGPVMGKFSRRDAERWLNLLRSTTAEADFFELGELLPDELRKFDFPILALYGEGSHAKHTGDELCQVWPEAEFRLVRNAGHFFPVSRADEVIVECNRFWDSCDDSSRRVRRPHDTRAYFQSDRFYMENGEWYCKMRGEPPLGPFASREDAIEQFAIAIGRTVT